ncbi:hypothetical protein HYH03_015195 [Edaphochlamys debaryana]|uniref:Protein kinase domain-containing protein n=1 Tax=Edaphochlamys debaryana TaxID=47281 RepID=A0A836BRE4_9CHLO|nr:hypothetical protein HYH03_015195 [Edaphochlamys debaryana]|eukprot:KAG2486100.1 hypothetical protein HYH03_015195 [Edaphochlamys debaryana]
MENFTKGTLMRGTTLNLLTPSPEGTRGATVRSWHRPSVFAMCLPPNLWEEQMLAAPRPSHVAGRQVVSTRTGPHTDCVNGSSAPPLKRCWAAVYTAVDVALEAAGLDAASNPTSHHYTFHLRDCDFFCAKVLEQSCVDALGPLGCMLVTISKGRTPAPPTPAPPGPTPPDPMWGAGWAAGGSDDDGPPSTAVLVGSVVAGVVVLAVLGASAAALLLIRRHQRRRSDSPTSSSGSVGSACPLCTPDTVSVPPGSEPAPPLPPGTDGVEAPCAQPPLAGREDAPSAAAAASVFAPRPGKSDHPGSGAEEVVITFSTPFRNLPCNVMVLDGIHPADKTNFLEAGVSSCNNNPTAPEPSNAVADHVVRLTGLVLGKGAFGRVYEGTYRGRLVAVKTLPGGVWSSPVVGDALLQEIEVLGRCDHPNIVKLLAACVVNTPEPALVLERMDTSLDKMLYGSTGTLLPLRLVLHIAIQVAQGLSYLHPTVLHRDLKPANVLLSDPNGEAPIVKLSDFGLSRLRESVLVTLQPDAGTPPYVAPECFDTNCNAITHLADCYSFGVLLWEMLAGVRPWSGMSGVQVAYAVTLAAQRLPLPPHDSPGRDVSRWPPRVRRVLWQCWEVDPRRRPAAAEIVKALTQAKEDIERGST